MEICFQYFTMIYNATMNIINFCMCFCAFGNASSGWIPGREVTGHSKRTCSTVFRIPPVVTVLCIPTSHGWEQLVCHSVASWVLSFSWWVRRGISMNLNFHFFLTEAEHLFISLKATRISFFMNCLRTNTFNNSATLPSFIFMFSLYMICAVRYRYCSICMCASVSVCAHAYMICLSFWFCADDLAFLFPCWKIDDYVALYSFS